MSDNVCPTCKGAGSGPWGGEYMGSYEMLTCDECAGTGLERPWEGDEELRAENKYLKDMLKEIDLLVADQQENIGLGRRRTILYEDVRVLCALGEGFSRIPRQ